jgi:SAM-dependent methyltransferase
VDSQKFPGVDVVMDLEQDLWPWKDNSVEEVYSSHFLEHLPGASRIKFFNELYRILKPGGTAQIITPDWSHACAYGDPTHQWPPMSGWYPLYLQKAWRDANAPHVPYTCDFEWSTAMSWDPWLNTRAEKEFPMQRYINSTRDLIVNLSKAKK